MQLVSGFYGMNCVEKITMKSEGNKMPFKDLPEGQTQYLDENGNTVGDINPLLNRGIDVLYLSTKTKNNLKYYGFNTIGDLYQADILNNSTRHWKLEYFSNKLRYKIFSEIQRFLKETGND